MTLTIESMRADVTAVLDDLSVPVGLDDDLVDLGLDSMRMHVLAMRWNEAGLSIDISDLLGHRSLRMLHAALHVRGAAHGRP